MVDLRDFDDHTARWGAGGLGSLLFILGFGFNAVGAEPLIRVPVYAVDFPYQDTVFEREGQWLRLPEGNQTQQGDVSKRLDLDEGTYEVSLHVVGENDGRPLYRVFLNDEELGSFQPPLASGTTEEGEAFQVSWPAVAVKRGDTIRVTATTDSENGSDRAWGRWSKLVFSRPLGSIGATSAQQTLMAGLFGERKKWHRITLAFEGPDLGERSTPNPFADYRLDVLFTHPLSGKAYTVPGYYAADGFAGETGAETGKIWRVHFAPDETGLWTWKASFRRGENIAMHEGDDFSEGVAFDGESGAFQVGVSDKEGTDGRARGRLDYTGDRYLRFAETGGAYLKGGADSPENLLAYVDFDGAAPVHENLGIVRAGEAAEAPRHRYRPHMDDWRTGDPSWRGGKGKSIIGVLNYLASEKVNSIYFLTMNVGGDGDDVWPWTAHDERFRFDCSKLDQWEIVFTHMDRLGMLLHVVTQETENDQLLDSGALGLQRRLYYRELVARFGHHSALVWNFGEENTNTDRQRSEFAHYFEAIDPYGHPVVVHTYPGQYDRVYPPLLGHPHFEGPSLQMGDMAQTHSETLKWVNRSAGEGRQWVVFLDEIGPAHTGVKPDAVDPDHDEVRHHALWGNLMAGGGGVEWYFGYQYDHNDLNCEDLRSRENMWRQTRIALAFFHRYLPFAQMGSHDGLTPSEEDYCFAKAGEVYCIYTPSPGPVHLNLTGEQGDFFVYWFNPKEGGDPRPGSQARVSGGGANVSLGQPPVNRSGDWVVLVQRKPL